MSSNPHQLFLLADHVKLSLLERQRAITLNLEPNKQDGHITRSLETLREGLEALERQQAEVEEFRNESPDVSDQITRLRSQYNDLATQFDGPNGTPILPGLTKPNNPSLKSDFAAASRARPSQQRSSSLRQNKSPTPKSVRFRDNPSPEDPNRAQLLPYRDDPDDAVPDQSSLDNQQIHSYHKQVIMEQDDQLDRLGESVGRQRDLSIQMGTELDEHVGMLDDIDEGVDRHQGTLDRARKRLGTVSRRAKDNWSWLTIGILILVLVLLILVLK